MKICMVQHGKDVCKMFKDIALWALVQQLSPMIAAAEDSLARLEWAPDTADEDELEATRAHLRTAHGALVSTKRAKERKLRALKREFQLLREQGRLIRPLVFPPLLAEDSPLAPFPYPLPGTAATL